MNDDRKINQLFWTWAIGSAILLSSLFFALKAPAAEPIWLSNLGQQATGTNNTGKYSLDVNVTSPITATNLADGPTGSAVPADAAYIGASKAGTLTGLLIGQQTMANSLACVLPSDQSAIPVSQGGSPWGANVTQFGGSAVATGTGTGGLGIPRVTVSSDSNMLATQSGTWTVQPGNTANTTPWLATINQGGNSATVTVSGALKVDGSAVTQPVSGTVTVNQGTANTAANGWTVKPTDGTNSQGYTASSEAKVSVTQPLPAGSNAIGTVQVTSAKASVNATASNANSTVTTTPATLTAPANAVGFLLQNISTSTANVRWQIGGAASSSSGAQLAPGQDTGFIPAGSNVSIAAESGTQSYSIQWVSQ